MRSLKQKALMLLVVLLALSPWMTMTGMFDGVSEKVAAAGMGVQYETIKKQISRA